MFVKSAMRSSLLFGLAVALAAPVSRSQSPPAQPDAHLTFDAASIVERKPDDPPPMVVSIRQTPGRITGECATLRSLIFFALNLSFSPPIDNLPNWGNTPGCAANTYQLQATLPVSATKGQAQQMMQSLLADRFKFAYHWESRVMPVYALVVAKGGFKLKPYDPKTDKPMYGIQFRCPPQDPDCHVAIPATGPLSNLANSLGADLGRPVVDKTGVKGDYQMGFNWEGDNSPDSPLPSIPAALRDKFGLELKPDRAPVNVLVIDHVEKPTPN